LISLRILTAIFLFTWAGFVPYVWSVEAVQVTVEGITGAALENVEAALVIPPGFVRNGKADLLWLKLFDRQTPDKVKTALQPFGFYNAQVTTTLETVAAENYRLRVKVAPGTPALIENIHVAVHGAGAKDEMLENLVRDFPLKKGDVLLHNSYEAGKIALKSRAIELGYLKAEFSTHEIRISRDKTTARIELQLETEELYSFDGTRIIGAPEYPERFLRRYLGYKSGEPFSLAKLNETQLNFINSDRFKEVIVSPEREKIHELQVPVLVQLKPSANRRLRVGAGYGTDTGARFTGRYKDLNMMHLGHELQTELYIAQRLQGLGIGYLIPGSRDINNSTAVQLNLQREDVSAYTSRLISLEVNRNKGFGSGRLGTAYLRLLQEDFTIGSQKSGSRLVLPGVVFSGRHYDNLIRPNQGYRYTLEVRGTQQFLGSDTGLIQFLAEGSAIFPLPGRFSLFTRGKVGITAQNDLLSDLPPSIRFFAGGDNSVRGYSYQSLGPRDATGSVVGGKDLLVGSLELHRAFFNDWGLSAFFDTGNAFDSFSSIRFYSGAGIGAHYYTRIGSINLYLARQIGVTDPGYHVHFTVGIEL
jgi:translocation and assembly module TamA